MIIDLENTLELAVTWAKEVGEVQRSYFRGGALGYRDEVNGA